MTKDIKEFTDAIFRGEFDEQFNTIREVIKTRQTMLDHYKKMSIKPGDRVRLVNLRPKYMVGATGTVLNHNQTRITVKLDPEWMARNPQSRFASEVKVTANMIEIQS